jgi:phosphatidylglycerophosphate synthase
VSAAGARRYTLADVRRSYTAEKAWAEAEGDLPSYLLYRPLSIWLTPAFIRLGFSPLGVTLVGLLLAAALVPAALWGGQSAYLLVAGLVLCHHVLDCVDGNIARTTGQASGTGALLDGFCDLLFWTLYFLALGVLAERASGGLVAAYAVELSLGLALLVLLHRQLRDSYALQYADRAEFTAGRPARLTARMWARMALIALERFYVFGLVAAGALGALETLLVAIAVYVVAIFVAAVVLTFTQSIRRDAARSATAEDRPRPGSAASA